MAKYDLVGVDGNAYVVMGYVVKAMKTEGFFDEIYEYKEKAMSGDYNNLLRVSIEYVDMCNDHAYENGYEDTEWEDNDDWDEDYDNEW